MGDLLDACTLGNRIALSLGADEVEVYGRATRETEAFLERNDVRLGKSHTHSIIGIRVLKGGSMGFSSVNSLERDEIEDAASTALRIANSSPPDEANVLPEGNGSDMVAGLYDPAAEQFTPSDAIRTALSMLESARSFDRRVTVDSGTFNASLIEHAIKNSSGIERDERISLFTWAIMGMARDANEISNFDYQMGGTHMAGSINVERTAKLFSENVVSSLGAKGIESFRGDIVLTPQASMELILQIVISSLNSNNVQKGMSRLKGKIGERVASELISIIDDGGDKDGLASSSFDREGVSRSPLSLVERGVLRSFFYNTYTAKKEGRKSTGHAMGSPRSSPIVGPSNIIIGEGTFGREELINTTRRGVLVSRFSGNVSSVSGDFSGVVKSGFLIEDGEVKHPVRETLIAGNVFDLLNNVDGLSKERERVESALLPSIKVRNIAITGG